jgi:hypothetical protein
MKKVLLSIICVLILCSSVFAAMSAPFSLPRDKNRNPVCGWAISNDVLLNAVTSTGAGSTFDLAGVANSYAWMVTWGGTTPTNTVVRIEGSFNGTNWFTIDSQTVTSTNSVYAKQNLPALYIRGYFVSKSGGDGTTSVTLRCLSIGW